MSVEHVALMMLAGLLFVVAVIGIAVWMWFSRVMDAHDQVNRVLANIHATLSDTETRFDAIDSRLDTHEKHDWNLHQQIDVSMASLREMIVKMIGTKKGKVEHG